MKLHPYKEFTVETNLAKEEVVERLNSLKRPKKRWFWNKIPEVVATFKKPEKRYYTVEFEGDKFAIYIDFNIRGLGFITDFFRGDTELGGSHKIDGEVLGNDLTTYVRFGFTPPFYNLIALYILLVLGIVGDVIILFSKAPFNDVTDFITLPFYLASPIFPAIFIYFFMSHSLNKYFNTMHPFLTQIFEDK